MATSKAKGPDPNRKRLAAQRAAARERIAAAQRRRRLVMVASAVGVIVVVVAALIVVKVVAGNSGPKSGTKAVAANVAVSQGVGSVPQSVFDAVGIGNAKSAPKTTNAPALVQDGKPRVLFVGAEWCPYCAGERWAIATALSRFGTFSGLKLVRSSPSDVYPNTATLSFYGAKYTSKYLAFSAEEVQSNQVKDGHYTTLDTLDKADAALFKKAGGAFPFLDLGGTHLVTSTQYDPAVLKGMTQRQIALALSQPNSAIAKAVVGSANLLTATLCTLTKNAPAAVCASSGVTTAAAAIAHAG